MITIDATNKKLGRIASIAAAELLGKNSTTFTKNAVNRVHKVVITNASKIDISEKKLSEEVKKKYSGYPGGLTHESFKKIAQNKGYGELFKTAIYGMLPKNKLRKNIIQNLKVTE